jgi:hypothetical protein
MDNAAYKQGFIDGIKAYAYMNNGTFYIGTTGGTLEKAILEVEKTWNYATSPTEVVKLRHSNHETITLPTENTRLD